MNPTDDTAPEPYFHVDTGAVRFWVRDATIGFVGASIRKEALHYRFGAAIDGADALDTYLAHRSEIDAAVVRRIAKGSREPVMLRETDVAAAPVR
jgi:Protein of unknown function (DUF1488)